MILGESNVYRLLNFYAFSSFCIYSVSFLRHEKNFAAVIKSTVLQ